MVTIPPNTEEVSMGQLMGTTFGIGTPAIYPVTQNFGGFSPYAGQGFGTHVFPQQPYVQTLSNPFIGGGYNVGPYGIGTAPSPVLHQIAQLLQIVPQQLQQVQLLQQQQALHLQQLLQWLPTQLQQLQQLIQVPHQGQQLQQQGQPLGAAISGPLAFGLVPQAFAGQAASHVM
jgi:hypothetical protein